LTQLFRALRGFEEWGVRVIAGEVEADSARALSSGRDYLQVKKRLNAQTVAPPRATVRTIDSALRLLGTLASKRRKEMLPVAGRGRPYAAAASFLVAAKRRDRWKKQAAKLAAALSREGHRLEMSGPWPPYHFVSK
jgi:hypothetical protein